MWKALDKYIAENKGHHSFCDVTYQTRLRAIRDILSDAGITISIKAAKFVIDDMIENEKLYG